MYGLWSELNMDDDDDDDDDSRVGPGCVLCTRIDPLRFLAGCRRRRLNQGLVVGLGFFSLLDRACFCVIFFRFMGACFV